MDYHAYYRKAEAGGYQEYYDAIAKAQGIDPSEFMKTSMIAGKTQTLQGRNATSEEQASTILYFASDEARHITGSIVVADGGFTVY